MYQRYAAESLIVVASIAEWTAVVAAAISVVPAIAALYLLTLATAAIFHRAAPSSGTPSAHLTVIVPAHNESDLIGRCVASLSAQNYPRDRFEVIVIADNCTDGTAALARSAGAKVLERTDAAARGKGRALRWAMDSLNSSSATDAFVVVDGDSVADTEMLRELADALERGASVVQADYSVLVDHDSARVRLRALAFLLFHRVRFSGRAALGLPCSLVGNGMLLARTLMEKHPWDAYTGAEDLEFSVRLRLNGFCPVFAGAAHIAGPVPASARAALVQRERWEGGRLHVARRMTGPLVRSVLVQHRLRNIDALVDLLIPPFGLLALSASTVMTSLLPAWLAGYISPILIVPPAVAIIACVGYVLVGMVAGGAPASMYTSLLAAPIFIAEKIGGLRHVVRHQAADTWIRTERPSDVAY